MIEFRKSQFVVNGRDDRVEIRHDTGSVLNIRIEGYAYGFAVADMTWTVLPGEFCWQPNPDPTRS